jgi:hypothetical protein
MALGWKVLLPLAVVYLSVLATAIWYLHGRFGWTYGTPMALALGGVNLVLLVALLWWLDRGRIVSGSVAEEPA